jgi:cobalt-precorrin-5B (C1)-methyltransferase
MSSPRSGYTLPVFACAAAIAALRHLHREPFKSVQVNLLDPAAQVEIAIAQVAGLSTNSALAITYSDPGDNLDLTRGTPIWALVEVLADGEEGEERITGFEESLELGDAAPAVVLEGGEGIGITSDGSPAIYAYARRLLLTNLQQYLVAGERIRVKIILPEGRELAKRTSNAAFGVVEGLSLLGTSGIAQPLSAPGQLEAYRQELQEKAQKFDCLVFCVGENGLDLAAKLGIEPTQTLKTANWIGSLLVEAGLQQVKEILLFGYHGKLIKLAGGIFHTHHHVADGRLEILTAHCARAGLAMADLQIVFACKTTEDGLSYLRQLDTTSASGWVDRVYGSIATTIDRRTQAYIQTHSDRTVKVGTVLFDRDRRILTKSDIGDELLQQISQKCS